MRMRILCLCHATTNMVMLTMSHLGGSHTRACVGTMFRHHLSRAINLSVYLHLWVCGLQIFIQVFSIAQRPHGVVWAQREQRNARHCIVTIGWYAAQQWSESTFRE